MAVIMVIYCCGITSTVIMVLHCCGIASMIIMLLHCCGITSTVIMVLHCCGITFTIIMMLHCCGITFTVIMRYTIFSRILVDALSKIILITKCSELSFLCVPAIRVQPRLTVTDW